MNPKILFALLLILFSLVFLRTLYFTLTIQPYSGGEEVNFRTKVEQQPRLNEQGQRFSLVLPNSQRAIVTLNHFPVLNYGDEVQIKGSLKYVSLKEGGKILVVDKPSFSLVKQESRSNLLLIVRERIISFFRSSLGTREASLLLGIVFGIKGEMPKDFSDDLRLVGLTHVVVASGMNITMVGGFLAGIFTFFFRRQTALVLSIVGICLYALLAGAEPSIVRAAIMGILVFSAQIIGRQSLAYLGLFLAGSVMLLINPSLIFDVGFQLTFLATFGLIFFRPVFLISQRLKRVTERTVIGEDLLTTLTAQLFTLPILLLNFGQVSLLSVFVNALVLWTVPIIMVIGAISAAMGLVFEPFGRLASYLTLPFLFYFEKMVEVFSSFKLQLSITSLPLSLIGGYYLLLFSLAFWFKEKK